MTTAAEILEMLPPDIREAAKRKAAEDAAEAAYRKSAEAAYVAAETTRAGLPKRWHAAADAFREHFLALEEAQAQLAEIAYQDSTARDRQIRARETTGQPDDIPSGLPYLGLDAASPGATFLTYVDSTIASARK